MVGYRLKAGTQFDHRILKVLQGVCSNLSKAKHSINELTCLPTTVSETLKCLASDVCSVKQEFELIFKGRSSFKYTC